MIDNFIITEWLLNNKIEDFKIFIYKIKNIIFNDVQDYIEILKKELNKDIIISSFGTYIMTFYPLNILEINKKIDNYELLDINIDNNLEIILNKEIEEGIKNNKNKYQILKEFKDNKLVYIKTKLIEIILLESIKYVSGDYWRETKNGLLSNKFLSFKHYNDNIEIYEKLKLMININNNKISIGFLLSYVSVSEKLLDLNNTKKGTPLISIIDSSALIFDSISNKTMNDEITIKNKKITLYDYHKKNIEKFNINENSKVIDVYYTEFGGKKSNKTYLFPYEALRLDKNNITNNKSFYEFLKKNNKSSIKDSINYMFVLLNNLKEYLNKYKTLINFDYKGIDIEKHGFSYKSIDAPKFKCRSQEIDNLKNIDRNGILQNIFKPIKTYIIDLCKINDDAKEQLKEGLEKYSKNNLKINLLIEYIYVSNIKNIEFSKDKINALTPCFVILQKDSINYNNIKKLFGKKGIPTQMITIQTVNKLVYNIKNDIKNKSYYTNYTTSIMMNILFGLLFKSGIKIWSLETQLNHDYFVGIDVSHENGFHAVSCVMYIFKNKLIYTSEYGVKVPVKKKYTEQLPENIVKDIIDKIINQYKKIHNKLPKTVIIHRDGFCRKMELNVFKSEFEYRKIDIIIISILKKINRKVVDNNYNSKIGSYINYQNNVAFLISTENRGDKTANAFKIKIVYPEYDKIDDTLFRKLIEEIYYLSYMCQHTILKTRLPATIHYADSSSTARNRDFFNNNKQEPYQRIYNP